MERNKLLYGVYFTLLLIFGPPARADHFLSVTPRVDQAGLGYGYDQNKQELKAQCLTGTTESLGGSGATVNFEQAISFSQLEKELGVSGSARAKFGVVEVKAAAKFLSNSKSDAYSVAATYVANYEFKNIALKDPVVHAAVAERRGDDLKWEEACGYEYVQQISLGAKLFFTIRVDFTSEAEKRAFDASFSISAPLWGVEGSLETISNSFSKRTKVTITTFQLGGEVGRLSQIFKNPDNIVSCSIGDFDKCRTVLSTALDYATEEFPKQIAKETHGAGAGAIGTGPAAITYITKPYATAGIFNKNAPEMLAEVKRARLRLHQWMNEYFDIWSYANRYAQAGARRLSERQSASMKSLEASLDKTLKEIADAGQLCYDHPDAGCVDAANAFNVGGEHALAKIDKTVFLIENESFAQFCDDGLSPGPWSTPSLKNSITGLLSVAKKIKADAFRPPVENASVDECLMAGLVFRGATKIDAAKIGLTDLRPLMEFVQLEELDLSDNQIESLEPFSIAFAKAKGGFASLRTLNLHNNRIRTVASLVDVPNLERLNLSNNRIEAAEALRDLPFFSHVDLRNNSQYLKLQLGERVTVLTADHGSSPLFSDITRMLVAPRYAHQAMAVKGEVLITGGIYGTVPRSAAEIYENREGGFSPLAGMAEARQWHTMTRLRDGRILILGGFASRSGEIYNPASRTFRVVRGDMVSDRAGHTATLLNDGRVLVTGGWRLPGYQDTTLTVEIFDPATEQFTLLPEGLAVPRAAHTATLMPDGRVLIAGGMNDAGSANTVDVYDPATNDVQPLGARLEDRRGYHTATLLPDGKLLVLGGINGEKSLATGEIYDPAKNRFFRLPSEMKTARMGFQSTPLENGLILITGGSTGPEEIRQDRSCKACVTDVEIFDPATKDFSLSNNPMVRPRVFHTVTRIRPYSYLIVGGLGTRAGETAEILSYGASGAQEKK